METREGETREERANEKGAEKANKKANEKWSGKSRGGGLGTWIFVMLVKHLGLTSAYALLVVVVPYFVLFAPKSTRAVWYFGRHVRRLSRLRALCEIFATYYVFGQCIVDKIAIGQGQSHRFRFIPENESEMRALFCQEIPLIVMSGHVGAWEAGSTYFSDFGKKMNVVMRDAEHEAVKRAIKRGEQQPDAPHNNKERADNRRFGIIPLANDGLESVLRIKEALDKREVVCFMGDRYMEGSATREHKLLGKTVRLPMGPYQVAATMRVPVAFYFAMREKGPSYRFLFKLLETDKRRRPEEIMDQYVAFLETILRKYPRQWFNLYNYFEK